MPHKGKDHWRTNKKGKVIYHIHPDLWHRLQLLAAKMGKPTFEVVRMALGQYIGLKTSEIHKKRKDEEQRFRDFMDAKTAKAADATRSMPGPKPKPTTVEE